jgi:hypothetical protein
MWDENNYTHFLQPHFTPINIMFTKDGIHTLVNVVITYPTWVNLLHWSCIVQGFVASKTAQAKKRIVMTNTPWSFPLLNNLGVWMFKQTSWCILTQLCQCHVEHQKVKLPSSFCFGYFSPLKKFNYIAKNANIFHLKSGSSGRFNYFLISTPSKHTPHHHGWPLTSNWLLRWRDFNI